MGGAGIELDKEAFVEGDEGRAVLVGTSVRPVDQIQPEVIVE